MDNDFFSNLSKNYSGLQKTFLIIGTLWFVGTFISLYNFSTLELFGWLLIWGCFFIAYALIKWKKIESSRAKVWFLAGFLIFSKFFVGTFLVLPNYAFLQHAKVESTWEADNRNSTLEAIKRSKSEDFRAQVEELKNQTEQKQDDELEAWREKAQNGDIEAISILCNTYAANKRILSAFENDDNYGPLWCSLGAERGDTMSQISLAYLYYQGRGVTKDENKAFDWMSKAANSGDPFAQHSLGNYYYGGVGTREDLKKSAYWHRRAAEQGYVDAQVAVGLEYFNGWGVVRNYIEAYAWFNLAAAQGSDEGAKIRDKIEPLLLGADLSKSQELSRDFFIKYSNKSKELDP